MALDSSWEMLRRAVSEKKLVELYYTNRKSETKRYEIIPVSIRGFKDKSIGLYGFDTAAKKIKLFLSGSFRVSEVMTKDWPIGENDIGYPVELSWPERQPPEKSFLVPMTAQDYAKKKD